MTKKTTLLGFLVFLGWRPSPASAMDLIRNGRAVAAIVTPDDPWPVEQFAAQELQYHLRLASGATLSIIAESRSPAGPRVFVGGCRASREVGIDRTHLPPNGFILRVVGDSLFLIGDDSKGPPVGILHNNRERVGTLFAVYEFLEKQVGVRWLWPGELGTVVPPTTTLSVSALAEVGKPAFIHARWRDGFASVAGKEGWSSEAARSRFLSEQAKWLRRHRFALGVNMDMAHAFTKWWEREGKAHPEYFNLLPDGTRRPDPTYHGGAPSLISMCVSQPAFHQAIVAAWKKRRTPQNPNIDCSENDTPGKCTCPRCLSWDVPDPTVPASGKTRLEQARAAFRKGDGDWYTCLGSLSDRYARYYLAVQREAEKIDPNVVVMGYAYANYIDPPRQTKLNDRVIIGVVPPLYFPWTDRERRLNRARWDGWRATGARLFLRPNWMLDGHDFPIIWAHKLGEDFRYFAAHGLIGTDFDSLTGQYATQGPNLYVLARLHDDPTRTVNAMLDEYYAAFGNAADAVRAYFTYWENLCAAVTHAPPGTHWSTFYRTAGQVFTPAALARGRRLLTAAVAAARDETVRRRVTFLVHGLRNVQLTLTAQEAYERYRAKGDLRGLRMAVQELDAFRRSIESDLGANMCFLAWAENRTWDRTLLAAMPRPGIRLPDPWKFRWDPDKRGLAEHWFAADLDPSDWVEIRTDGPWEEQPVGKQWRREHGADYDGVAWYRTTFRVNREEARPRVRLIFGGVDEACTVWVNGTKLLERPYPYRGDRDSWRKAFEVDVTNVIRYDRDNTLAVRVEDNSGAGGVWRPVWLLHWAPMQAEGNVLNDGGFEQHPTPWRKHVMCGEFTFALDRTAPHGGRVCARLQCTKLAPPTAAEETHTRAWARWYQTEAPVKKEKTYRFRAWVKTSADFGGRLALWVVGEAQHGTVAVNVLGTEGVWREVTATGIRPKGDHLAVYLNVMDGVGTAWFDDIELTPEESR